MKSVALVFAVLVSAGPWSIQIMAANQRQDSVAQLIGATIAMPDKGLQSTSKGEKRIENTQAAALTQMMNAVNAGDAKSYADLYAPAAVITIYGGIDLKGRSVIEQYEAELMREFPGARLAFYSVWHKGTLAIAHYGVNGRTTDGRSMGHEGLLFFQFDRSGLIIEEHRYLDSLTPMAQMGMLGQLPTRAVPKLPSRLKTYVGKTSAYETRNVALVKANFLAWDSKNEESFVSGIAKDAVLDEMMLPQPFIGIQKMKIWFKTWTNAVPDATTEIVNILGVGDFVLVETVVHGTLSGPLGRLAESNRTFAVHRAAVVQMRAGEIRSITAFMNGKELAEAVGQWPPAVAK